MNGNWLVALALCLIAPAVAARATRAPGGAAPRLEFNRDIRPILSENCFACHGPDRNKRQANLRLDVREAAVQRGAIIPGRPEQSPLVARVFAATPALLMPPAAAHKRLTSAQKQRLRRWIAAGAPYQAHWSYLPLRRRAVPAVPARWAAGTGMGNWSGGGSRPAPGSAPLPATPREWVRNPIDAFILDRIRKAGLTPAPEADPVTLIRRLWFDLTGLPPTPAAVDAFLADRRPDAYPRLVDRLLASPRYGERMASHWLDLVRYADTVGYHGDQEQAISPYRDWVIKALNDNLPFDQFTVEQLAGDLLLAAERNAGRTAAEKERGAPPAPPAAPLDAAAQNHLIASGYNRLLQTTHEGGAQDREYRAKYAADRVRNLSAVWMGATMGCAECHDHKYDPYTQKDFYSLAAFFADVEERGAYPGPDTSPTRRAPELEVLSPFDQEEADRLRTRLEALKARPGNDAGLADLQRRWDELQKRKRPTMITVAVPPRTVRVLRRGDWMDDSGEVVLPAVPRFLPQPGVSTTDDRSPRGHPTTDGGRSIRSSVVGGRVSSGRSVVSPRRLTRLDLARWLTGSDQPQTARVFVNRIWYLLFGNGLCRSLEDTGSQGEWPTHPELLDWLAVRFRDGAGGVGAPAAWDMKALVRLIVLSSTYRQSASTPAAEQWAERLFARQGRFRLPAEMIRDQALAASGLLVERLGGPNARPYQPDGYYSLLNFPTRDYQADRDANQYRRGVYVHWQRQYLHPMLRAFDAPSREECTARRPVTNTPLAALALLNDPTFVEAARVLAARALREGGDSEGDRIRWVWRVVLSRAPADREVAALAGLYRRNRHQYAADPAAARELLQVGLAPLPPDLDPVEVAAWTAVTRALLNLSETITRGMMRCKETANTASS